LKKPKLWLKRLAIFKSLEKRNEPIRNIQFHRGLNIVWGVVVIEFRLAGDGLSETR